MINVARAGCCVNAYCALVRSIWWKQRRQCPRCGTWMHKHGFYERYADELWRCEKIPIRRYRCPRCRRTVSYPPSFLRPYRSPLVWVQEFAARWWALGHRCGAWGRSWCGRGRPFAVM